MIKICSISKDFPIKSSVKVDMDIRFDNIVFHFVDPDTEWRIVLVNMPKALYAFGINCNSVMYCRVDPSSYQRLDQFMSGRTENPVWEVLQELQYNPEFGLQLKAIHESFQNSAKGLNQ